MATKSHTKSWFRNTSARVKLLGSFLIVSGLLSAACIVAVVKMGAINTMLNGLYERELVGLSACQQATINLTKGIHKSDNNHRHNQSTHYILGSYFHRRPR